MLGCSSDFLYRRKNVPNQIGRRYWGAKFWFESVTYTIQRMVTQQSVLSFPCASCKADTSISTANAGNLVVMNQFRAAPLPRLSVHVGTTMI